MARIDFTNDSADRYSVWHHRFDSETKHFRWFLVDCFSTEREMQEALNASWRDLESRISSNQAQRKEQFVGRINKSSKSLFAFLRK